MIVNQTLYVFFFFNDTATTEIYTLSLHDALPIYCHPETMGGTNTLLTADYVGFTVGSLQEKFGCPVVYLTRSEEHTSELQSQSNLVCRLLLEKKKKIDTTAVVVMHVRRQQLLLQV